MKKTLLLGTILSFNLCCIAQDRIIRGVVLDETSKDPLASATVKMIGSDNGTTTDARGNFYFSVSPDCPALLISYTGYYSDTVILSSSQRRYIISMRITEGRLHDVIVTTGVSRALPVKENPIQVMVISARTIDQSVADNIIDALAQNAPGFNSVKTGPGVSKPFIHGLGYNRVLTLYDGVRQESQQWGDEHGIVVDDYNIERAEIIKGPASLMYGSDALAGVVSLFPVMPYNTQGLITGRYTTEFQSNNGLYGNGIRVICGNDHWSYALRGSYRIAKNYRDPIDGWVYNTNFRTTNASLTVMYKGTAGFTTLNLNLYDHKQGIPDGSRDSLTRQFTKQVYETFGNPPDNIKERPLVPYDSLNSYLLSPLHQRIQDYKFYSNNHYAIGRGCLDGQFAITQNLRREYDHPTDPEQAGMYVRLFTLNYGIRYTILTNLNTEIAVGLNGMYQNNKSRNATDFPIADFNLFDAGPYLYIHQKIQRWAVTGGIRYDSRSLNGKNFFTRTDPVSGFIKQVLPPDTVGAYLQFPAFRKTFDGLSFSLGITYQVNDHIYLKINTARGFRAPNISEFASNGLDPGAHIVYLGNRNVEPEFSLQEDIGINFIYNNISASVSLFNTRIHNYIYEVQKTDPQGNPVVIVPGNKTFGYVQTEAELYGIEAIVNFHPSFVKGFSFDNTLTMINGINRNPEYKNQGVNGEYLPFMPPSRLLTGASKEFKLRTKVFTSLILKCQADINAAQNHYMALNHTETATPGYTLLNGGILVSIQYNKSSSLQLQVQANNMLGKPYESNQSRLKYFEYYLASPNGRSGIYDMGRNICIKMIVPF